MHLHLTKIAKDVENKKRGHILLRSMLLNITVPGADPGYLKRGIHLRSTTKKEGGGSRSNFGPYVKKPTSWPKGGGVRHKTHA